MKKNWHRNGRYRPLVRALKVFAALVRTRFGLTIPELLEEVECSRRTLYRYLAALDEAGVRFTVETRTVTGERTRRIDHLDGRRIRVA